MQFPDSFFEDEVRNGFFVPALMKRAWAAQMEILEDIARVCQKYHIRWFADFGTLLGAVRHKGFIPWDDDIDIGMLRDDYVRFIAVAQKELAPKGYYIPSSQERDVQRRLHSAVMNGKNLLLEKERLEKFHGFPYTAVVDIFPMSYVTPNPEDEELRKNIMVFIHYVAGSINEENQDTEEMKELVAKIEELLCISFDRTQSLKEQLYSLIENLLSLHTADEATEVAHNSWFFSDLQSRIYPMECFSSAVMLPFEEMELPVPVGYDKVLKIQFGDYMKYCRDGAAHDYPYYRPIEKQLAEEIGAEYLPYKYRFSKDELQRTRDVISPRKVTENFLYLTDRVHREIIKAVEAGDFTSAKELLEVCQSSAIRIGTMLEQTKGEKLTSVSILEQYCELTWQIHEELTKNPMTEAEGIGKLLNEPLVRFKSNIKNNAEMRKQIIFLPFKASCWNSLEPLWKEAINTPDCDVFVIPIPYYYKNWDGSLREIQYEGKLFPAYVPITDYNDFDFKKHLPEMMIVQNPYDEYNPATSVHPFFYTRNLKQYTDKLVYVPYFKLDEIKSDDLKSIRNMEYYVAVPGVIHADLVCVQSEQMRLTYIDFLTNSAGDDTKNIWEDKIICSSPIPFLKMR